MVFQVLMGHDGGDGAIGGGIRDLAHWLGSDIPDGEETRDGGLHPLVGQEESQRVMVGMVFELVRGEADEDKDPSDRELPPLLAHRALQDDCLHLVPALDLLHDRVQRTSIFRLARARSWMMGWARNSPRR